MTTTQMEAAVLQVAEAEILCLVLSVQTAQMERRQTFAAAPCCIHIRCSKMLAKYRPNRLHLPILKIPRLESYTAEIGHHRSQLPSQARDSMRRLLISCRSRVLSRNWNSNEHPPFLKPRSTFHLFYHDHLLRKYCTRASTRLSLDLAWVREIISPRRSKVSTPR